MRAKYENEARERGFLAQNAYEKTAKCGGIRYDF